MTTATPVCQPGYTGPDGGLCAACAPGTFKGDSGSAPCVDCPAGHYSDGEGATGCMSCPAGSDAPAGAAAVADCFDAQFRPVCFAASVALDSECPVASLPVRGCAASDSAEAGPQLLQIGAETTQVSQAVASCSAFYAWICPFLGGLSARQSDTTDCAFYCDFMAAGVSEELRSGCVTDEDCYVFDNHVSFQPAPGSLCKERAKYAIISSCMIADSQKPAFAANAEALLEGAAEDCEPAAEERIFTTSAGPGPDTLADWRCYQTDDCEYACRANGFEAVRRGAVVTVESRHVGACDCSAQGYFQGHIVYADESFSSTYVVVTNTFRDTNITLRPYRALNQLLATVITTRPSAVTKCEYVLDIESGSLLGLPVTNPSSTSDTAALEMLGYFPAMSNPPNPQLLALRRAVSIFPEALLSPERQAGRRAQEAAEMSDYHCPQAEDDCRYLCLTAGFEAEGFGPSVALLLKYDGECDCTQIVDSRTPDGRVALIGALKDEVTEVYYRFPDAFSRSFLPAAAEVNASAPVTCLLRPWDGDVMLLDVGPDICAYRWRVTLGQVIGVAALDPPSAAPQPSARLIRVSSSLAPNAPDPVGECAGDEAEGCEHACITGGEAMLTAANIIVGARSNATGCSCPTLSGPVQGERMLAGVWSFARHRPTGLLLYEFRGGDRACWGLLTVEGGFFLGVPRAPEDPDLSPDNPERNETDISGPLPVSVKRAEETARVITYVVSTALGISLAASAAAAVTAAVGAGTGAARVGGVVSGSGGGAAMTMIQQTQFLSLLARVGGPGAQPESSRAMSEGLHWSNFHIEFARLFPKSNSTESASRRDGDGDGGGGDETLAAEQEKVPTGWCQIARESPRELGSTLLTCAAGMVFISIAREILNRIVYWLEKRKRPDDPPAYVPTLPFLSWEVQVFLVMYMGIAESAGEAIASNCRGYEIAGGFVLLFQMLFLGGLMVVVSLVIRRRFIVWENVSLKDGVRQMRDAIRDSRGKSCIHRLRVIYEAWDVLNQRGDWEVDDARMRRAKLDPTFMDRYGSVFDSCRKGAYLYSFWCLAKAIATAVILAAVFSPVVNSSLIVAINAADAAALVLWTPNTTWKLFLQDAYRALVNLATLSSALAYLQGTLSEGWFSNLVVLLSICSLVPSTLESVLGPALRSVSHVHNMARNFIHFTFNLQTSATAGAVAGTAAYVMWGDTDTKANVLVAMEREDDAAPQAENRRRNARRSIQVESAEEPWAGLAPRPLPSLAHSNSFASSHGGVTAQPRGLATRPSIADSSSARTAGARRQPSQSRMPGRGWEGAGGGLALRGGPPASELSYAARSLRGPASVESAAGHPLVMTETWGLAAPSHFSRASSAPEFHAAEQEREQEEWDEKQSEYRAQLQLWQRAAGTALDLRWQGDALDREADPVIFAFPTPKLPQQRQFQPHPRHWRQPSSGPVGRSDLRAQVVYRLQRPPSTQRFVVASSGSRP